MSAVTKKDDVKIRVIDSDKLINAINEGSYDINLSAVMALGAVVLDTKQPESCEDAISRQEAVKEAKELFDSGECYADKFCIISMLNSLPSVHVQPGRWIPCSERLPEENYVLISKKPTKLSGSKWCVTIAIRTADPRSGKICWRDIGFGAIQDNEVLAWMPLPEPYKKEGEG